ncbi:hypothetical protein [Leptolyngbya sp. FACHB-261]|uniref:hypothetical protein n=1 Tax=Leptolyngbya sp. FACHB-261 TaxID=2692806 RepID=UPI0016867C8A|nr:hypothetical protein [Leptolyngbya sp. FACHB-261]
MTLKDPYMVGWHYGRQGVDLPDEAFSLFSWIGWLEGLQARDSKSTRFQKQTVTCELSVA